MSQIKDFPEKTIPIVGDCIPIQGIDGITNYITKENLFSGIGGDSGGGEYPNSFSHWHDESTVVSGAPIVTDLAAAYHYFTASYQPSNSVGDSFKFNIFVNSGNYAINIGTRLAPNLGMASLALNDSIIHSDLDFYGGGVYAKITRNINIITPGNNTITISCVGKNANSGAYYILLTKVWGSKL